MIKLKELMTEIAYKWSTAHHQGSVPDEVIDAGHKIIAIANRDDPDTHPEFWMVITQRPQLGMRAMDSHLVNKDVWYIDKPGKHEEGRYWILSFNNTDKHWQICYVKDGALYQRYTVKNESSLNALINGWVKNIGMMPDFPT
jgi:hypothetical protein